MLTRRAAFVVPGFLFTACTVQTEPIPLAETDEEESEDGILFAPDPAETAVVVDEPAPQPSFPIEELARRNPVGAEPSERAHDGPIVTEDDVPRVTVGQGAAADVGIVAKPDPIASIFSGNTATNDFHDEFGHAIVTGRFTNFLYDSVLVAAPYDDVLSGVRNAGKIYVFDRGGPDEEFVASGWVADGQPQGRGGWALAVGDFNDDFFDDVAVGVPFATVSGVDQAGGVTIFTGSASGIDHWLNLDQDDFAGGILEYGDRFGWALAAGDFDSDGVDDLAIGAPGENSGEGAVYVMTGGAAGFDEYDVISETGLDTKQPWDRFGTAVAAGDIIGNGYDDLVIGAPGDGVTVGGEERVCGKVFVFGGSAGAFVASQVYQPTAPQHDEDFGRALLVADFDDDGDDDIAIGAPGRNRSAGEVELLRGAPLAATTWTSVSEALIAGHTPAPGDRFGSALATGDLDDDGVADLVIGAPNEKYPPADSGLVYLLDYSGGAWGAVGSGWRSQSGLASNEPGDRFGAAIAVLEGDKLIVGAPRESIGTTGTRSGAVFLYDGGEALDAWHWISQD